VVQPDLRDEVAQPEGRVVAADGVAAVLATWPCTGPSARLWNAPFCAVLGASTPFHVP
jgi:hypothetical protein